VPRPAIHILVCTNDRGADAPKASCGQRRSAALYDRLRDVVRARGLRDTVLVTRTGCLKHCSRGSTVAVWPSNHWYGGVTLEDVERLLDAELGGAELVERRMPPGPWE
jgi:(2Fe-2S) ferredoxin